MKKILIIILGIAIFQSCSVTITPNEEAHYIDDDFILLEKNEENIAVGDEIRTIRTWKIQRITADVVDSVMVGIIDNKDDNGCGCGIITDELWFKRNVGDILHFDYIRKNRFFPVKNIAHANWGGYVDEGTTNTGITFTTTEEVPLITFDTPIINLNKLEIERRILEIEREIMSLEREKETLKEIQE